MFGGKGFGNSLGDDILNTFIQDTAKRTQPPKSTFNEADDKHLLTTKKGVQQLPDEEEPFAKKNPVIKTTSSLAQSNVIKKKPVDKKVNEDVDELLNLIDDVKGDKPGAKKPADISKDQKGAAPKLTINLANKAPTGNKFSEELLEEDSDRPAYDPTVREPRTNKSNTLSGFAADKKNTLFGLSNSAITNMNKSQSNDLQNTQSSVLPVQRPQTMESKPTKLDDDEIGEINLGFSRRKGKTASSKERPATTGGDLRSSQEHTKSSGEPEKPSFGSKVHEDHKHEEEGEEVESEYLSTIVSRDRNKKSVLGSFKTGDTPKVTLVKPTGTAGSPNSEFTASKEAFFPIKEVIPEEKKEVKEVNITSIPRSPVGILGKKELVEPQSKALGSTGLRKERTDGVGSRHENLQGSGLSGAGGWDTSQGLAHSDVLMKDGALQGYLKETEEYYKKRAKEAEEYYENRYKQLKAAMDEEKRKWEEVHEKELKLLKKENQDLKDNMNKHLERERERVKEVLMLEMESKEKIHRYEMERQRRVYEEQNDSLKKQLEAQAKLNMLADEIKNSSKKLSSLSDKMDQDKGVGTFGKGGELREKEKQLEELEKRLKNEMQNVLEEKKRVEKMRSEVESRIYGDKNDIEKEKEQLRKEYSRLSALQETMRKQELEKIKGLEKEKAGYEAERAKLEKELVSVKEEYGRKSHELEMQTQVQEAKRREFERIVGRTEETFLQRRGELEATAKRLGAIEMDLMGRVKELEHKEMLVNKSAEEVARRLDLLELEKIQFEKERTDVIRLAEEARRDTEAIRKFRLEFDAEQKKNLHLKNELAVFANNLRNERSKLDEEKTNLGMMQRTLEGIKSSYVKELNYGHERSPVERSPKYTSPRGFGDGFTSSKGRTQESTAERSPYKYVTQVSPERENRGRLGSPKNAEAIEEDKRMVRLQDLKKEAEERKKEKLMKDLQDLKAGGTSGRAFGSQGGNVQDRENWNKTMPHSYAGNPMVGDTFNYRNYMTHLKNLDRERNLNQGYIENEKEGLMQTKAAGLGSMASPKGYYDSERGRMKKTTYF